MQVNTKLAVIAGIFAIVIVAGAYNLGRSQGGEEQTVAGTKTAPTKPPAVTPPADQASRPIGPVRPGITPPAVHPSIPGQPGAATAVSTGVRKDISFTHFRIGNRNVKAMLADKNLVWVGTSGGVIRYDVSKDDHRIFDVRSGLLSNGIFHLSKMGDRLVAGTYGGGLSLFDPETETWSNYNIQHGLADAFVYDVLQTRSGDIWIATWSGANVIRGGDLDDRSKWEVYTVENTAGGLPNDWVYGLAEAPDGSIVIATEGGLARFKDDKWENWDHKDGLGEKYELVKEQIQFTRDPAKESSHHARQKVEQGLGNVDVAYNPNYIVSLIVAEDGTIWCGTWGGGLARYDGKAWKNFTVTDGLPANHIFMLRPGPAGNIWVGTSKGLSLFDGKTFKTFTVTDGLFADNVFSLADAADGSLWVGSYGGIARIKGLLPAPS